MEFSRCYMMERIMIFYSICATDVASKILLDPTLVAQIERVEL